MVHENKMAALTDVGFKNKLLEAAFQYAKGVLLGTSTNDNVKRFSQIVLKDISTGGAPWIDGLGYFALSTAGNITIASTQAQVTTEINTAFPYFAKAWYGDIT
jgi:hypothetical protein